jgi:hypothetical protein
MRAEARGSLTIYPNRRVSLGSRCTYVRDCPAAEKSLQQRSSRDERGDKVTPQNTPKHPIGGDDLNRWDQSVA